MCITFSKIALHSIGEKKNQRWMGRYDGFTLKKIRDSRTVEAPRPHSNTRLFLALVKSNARRIAVTIHEA
jgi:hypothetical protein